MVTRKDTCCLRGGRLLGRVFDNVQLCGFDVEFVDARRYINE